MKVSIRLTEEDFDLKKLFDDIEHSNKSLDDIVNSALSVFIDDKNILFGHIDLSSCPNLKNREVDVEILSPAHRTYLRKNSRYSNGSYIIKDALRKVYLFKYNVGGEPVEIENVNNNQLLMETNNETSILLKDTSDQYSFASTDSLLSQNFLEVLRGVRKQTSILDLSAYEFLEVFLAAISKGSIESISPYPSRYLADEIDDVFIKGLFIEEESVVSLEDVNGTIKQTDEPKEEHKPLKVASSGEVEYILDCSVVNEVLFNVKEPLKVEVVKPTPNNFFDSYILFPQF